MTVPQQPTRITHVGNGVTTVFAYDFLCLAKRDLEVIVDGVPLDQSAYSVSNIGANSGGDVTFNTAPADQASIIIQMNVVLDRETDYQTNGDLFSKTVNFDFDRLWLAVQQAFGYISRVPRLGDSDVDGQGAYRANNNRIQDLGDPINGQDAVNRQWVLSQIAGLAGDDSGQVVLDILADGTSSDLGVGLVEGAGRVVDTVADLRNVRNGRTTRVNTAGYSSRGDGGGAAYYLDASDTTSPDDGGAIIVATDGTRWKLDGKDRVSLLQFGAKNDGSADADPALAKMRAYAAPIKIIPAGTYLFGVRSATFPTPALYAATAVNGGPEPTNTTLGRDAGAGLTPGGTGIQTAQGNVAIGTDALSAPNTTSTYNVAVGHGAMMNASDAYCNVAVGLRTGQNMLGQYNTLVGCDAGMSLSTAVNENTLIGAKAGLSLLNGGNNTAVGCSVLYEATAVSNSVAVGHGAGLNQLTGFNNLYLGFQAGSGYTSSTNNVIIGSLPGVQGEANVMRFGTGNGDQRFMIDGNARFFFGGTAFTLDERFKFFYNGNTDTGVLLSDSSNASANTMKFTKAGVLAGSITTTSTTTAYNTSSDYRLKTGVVPIAGAWERMKRFKPVEYEFLVDPGKRVRGFIAHELQEVCPFAVTGEKDGMEDSPIRDEAGNITGTEQTPAYQGVDASKLVPDLVAALQEAMARIEALEQAGRN